ncbi:G protein [Puerto Almendras virus]|uniref:G protein n=1 Tax=Puerto Almendras virus TaxID=1479613 RepID=X4QM08_9RHAB|nr:G protein [Puerto Almendras virus]AHU86501.1 G protein [Puerto Almendras virus]
MITHKYILPIIVLSNFMPVKRDDLTCPIYNHQNVEFVNTTITYIRLNSVLLQSKSLELKQMPYVRGHICQKIRYITTCKANLFTSNEIFYKKEYLTVTKNDCEMKAVHETGEYPAPICTWSLFGSNLHNEEIIVTEIQSHDYHYDLFNGKIKDSEYLFEHCTLMYCKLREHKGYWIKSEPTKNDICPIVQDDEIVAELKFYNENHFLKINHHLYSTEEVCKIKYCNNSLLFFKDIGFFNIKSTLQKMDKIFKKCTKIEDLRYIIHDNVEKIDNLNDCLNFKLNVLTNKDRTIAYHDIRKLHPKGTGINRIYRLNGNNTLESAIAYYGSVESNETKIYLDYWNDCSKTHTCTYNGYMGKKGLNIRARLNIDLFQEVYEEDSSLLIYNGTTDLSTGTIGELTKGDANVTFTTKEWIPHISNYIIIIVFCLLSGAVFIIMINIYNRIMVMKRNRKAFYNRENDNRVIYVNDWK